MFLKHIQRQQFPPFRLLGQSIIVWPVVKGMMVQSTSVPNRVFRWYPYSEYMVTAPGTAEKDNDDRFTIRMAMQQQSQFVDNDLYRDWYRPYLHYLHFNVQS